MRIWMRGKSVITGMDFFFSSLSFFFNVRSLRYVFRAKVKGDLFIFVREYLFILVRIYLYPRLFIYLFIIYTHGQFIKRRSF